MKTGLSLNQETREGLTLLIGFSVTARLKEGCSDDVIRREVLRYVTAAVRTVGLDEWSEETLVAFAQRAIDAALRHAQSPGSRRFSPECLRQAS